MSRIRLAFTVLAVLLTLAGVLNFIAFIGASERLGGSAANGYVRDGRYFVGEHGRYQEVSREAWERSQSHGQTLALTHPLAAIGAAYLMFVWVFPRMMGPVGADTARRVEGIRASGPALASTSCSSEIGGLKIRGPLVSVSVHPGGVVLAPPFMDPRAVLSSELLTVQSKRSLLSRGISIEHASRDVKSPVILDLNEDSPVAQAIRSLPSAGR
jgi:hypothetical protein